MRNTLVSALLYMGVVHANAQDQSSKYQTGTIVSVVQHVEPRGADATSPSPRYDVSLKVGNVVYLVLYTPPNGVDTVKYKTGMDLLVLIEKDTITFHDLLGRSVKVPILSRSTVPAQSSK